MGRLIALDPVCAELAERAGLPCDLPGDPDAVDLNDVDVVFAAGVEGLSRAQAWRREGHRFAVVLRSVADAEDPAARQALEPLALLREATPDALRAAVASVEPGAALPRLVLAHGVADLAARRFTSTEGTATLSELQCRLLAYLADRAGRGVSREELQVQVWGHRTALNARAVDMAISRLRKKIEARPDAPASLLTAQGGGYRLVLQEAVPSRLPRPTDSFRGRGDLLGRLRARFDAGARALVLTGPPGVGKSRLALELAHALRGPAARVDAAELPDLQALITAIAAAVGVPAATEGTAAERSAALAGSAAALPPRLLLLDHVEGLGAAVAPLVDAFADHAPSWRLVLACHAAPAVRAEIVTVPPLSRADAEQLFRERARASGGDPGTDPAPLLPLLDGLPLAIELAAARTRALPVDQLADVLQRRRDLLAKPRGAEDRHASLADAVAEAAERAPAHLQQALVGLAPFEASFDLAAATAVLGPDAPILLVELVEDSLLQRETDRWRLLHAIRAWARGAGSDDDRRAAADAHLAWAAELAAVEARRAGGFEGRQATRRLAEHAADLRAAWARARDARAGAELIALTRGLDALWVAHGTEAQRRTLTDEVRAVLVDTPHEAEALLLWSETRFHAERAACREALQRAMEVLPPNDPSLAATVTWRLAIVTTRLEGYAAGRAIYGHGPSIEGASPEARVHYDVYRTQLNGLAKRLTRQETIDAMTALVERSVLIGALLPGVTAGRFAALRMQHTGDLDGALALRTRLMAWCEHFADKRVEGVLAVEMAYHRYGEHEFEDALRWFDRALEVIAVAEPVRRYAVLQYRALVLLHLRRYDEARADTEAFLGWARANGGVLEEIGGLDLLALLHLERGELVLAEATARRSVELCEQYDNRWQGALSRLQLADSLRCLGRVDEARAVFAENNLELLARAQAAEVHARALCFGPDPERLAQLEALLPGATFIGGPAWIEMAEALRQPRAQREVTLRRLADEAPTSQGRLCARGLLDGWAAVD